MLSEAVIHVGMHKTGSTSIQRTFSLLRPGEVEYLNLGSSNHSEFLATLLSDNPEKYHMHVAKGRDKEAVTLLRQQYAERWWYVLSRTKARTVILSAEDLGTRQPKELEKLKQMLEAVGRQVRVIGYVRPPVGYMQSAFQQRLKGNKIRSLGAASLFPSYWGRFGKIDNVFGRSAVELVPFVPDALCNQDVVLDFGNRVGLSLKAEQVIRANESLTLEACALLYVASKLGLRGNTTKQSRVGKDLVMALARLPGDQLKFSNSFVAPILELRRKEIDWMSRRLEWSIEDEADHSPRSVASENDLFVIARERADILLEIAEQMSTQTEMSDRGGQLPLMRRDTIETLTGLYKELRRMR